MKIGILGVGHIGKTLSRKLSAAGHDVKVANSRGPETIDATVLATGARAVPASEAVSGAVIAERVGVWTNPDSEYGVRLSRALFM
ncbi:NAD(P)-binding domain-containing protein [Nocardia gipuzkoensis]